MGFKHDLEKFANAPNDHPKVKTFNKKAKEIITHLHQHKKKVSSKPAKDRFPKRYKVGRRDMEVLLGMFSTTFCSQLVFVMGFGRKTEQSDPKVASYCDGFNDRLEEGK